MLPIDQPPLALGPFTSAAMLWWGLAAAVPIILHLLNRRRRQTVPFAAMQFLLAASRQQSRRMRLWQWLLLLARVAAVLMIAAALADPISGQRGARSAADDPPTLHVLVVDASYSMRATSGDGDAQVWDLAVQAAEEAIGRAAAGDAFCLAQMADPVVPVIVRPVRDAQAVRRQLRTLEPTHGSASLPATLAAVTQWIRDATEPQGAIDRVRVVMISDMQRNTWASLLQPDGRRAWQALAEIAAVEVVPVGQTVTPNRTVAGLRLASGTVAAGQPLEMALEVVDDGSGNDVDIDIDNGSGGEAGDAAAGGASDAAGDTADVLVQLQRDAQVIATTRLPRPALRDGATATLRTRLPAGETALAAVTEPDALDADNRQWLPLSVPATLRVVCVGDRRTTLFLAAAVAPRDAGPIEVRSVTPAQVDDLDEEAIDVLMLCDLRQPTPAIGALVQRAAQSGAGIVWWLGASVDAAAYRRAAQAAGEDLLPVLPVRGVDRGVYAIDPRAYAHPIAVPFQPHPQSGLLSTPVFRYWIVTPAQDPPAATQVALSVGEQGDPLLLTSETESGRVAVFTTAPSAGGTPAGDPADRSAADAAPWNALVAWPSFVPLVQETLRWVIEPRWARQSLRVGQPLTGSVPKTEGRPIRLTMPDGSQRDLSAVDDAGHQWRWRAGTALLPGVYWIATDSGRRRVLAVNVDPQEGDLRRFTAAVPDAPRPDRAAAGDAQPGGGTYDDAGSRWFRVLLAAAAGLLLADSLIGRLLLGRERSP